MNTDVLVTGPLATSAAVCFDTSRRAAARFAASAGPRSSRGGRAVRARRMSPSDESSTGVPRSMGITSNGLQRWSGMTLCMVVTQQSAITQTEGRFALPVRPGVYALEIVAPGAPPVVSENIEVRAGLDSIVDVSLPALDGPREASVPTLGLEWPF